MMSSNNCVLYRKLSCLQLLFLYDKFAVVLLFALLTMLSAMLACDMVYATVVPVNKVLSALFAC